MENQTQQMNDVNSGNSWPLECRFFTKMAAYKIRYDLSCYFEMIECKKSRQAYQSSKWGGNPKCNLLGVISIVMLHFDLNLSLNWSQRERTSVHSKNK